MCWYGEYGLYGECDLGVCWCGEKAAFQVREEAERAGDVQQLQLGQGEVVGRFAGFGSC